MLEWWQKNFMSVLMHYRENLDRSNHILQSLSQEQIQTVDRCTNVDVTRHLLNLYRELAHIYAEPYPFPGLTGCVATTLCKVAACQELAQKFALDYFIRYKLSNVSLIFTGNPQASNGFGDNHVFVLIGPIVAKETLFICRDTNIFSHEYQLISDFFKQQQQESVMADPYLQVNGPVHEPNACLTDYCLAHGITHVIGVKSYITTTHIVASANLVMRNAQGVANQLHQVMLKTLGSQVTLAAQSSRLFQPKIEPIDELMQAVARHVERHPSHLSFQTALNDRKFGLALRKASATCEISLLSMLLTYLSKHGDLAIAINEPSNTTGKNALHLANEHPHSSNKQKTIELLTSFGAKVAGEISTSDRKITLNGNAK